MSATIRTEFYENLQRAAGFDLDKAYPFLFMHLRNRKGIAEQLLHECDLKKIEELTEIYQRCTQEIMLILGL